ncbi:MAG: hypothetical protein KF753_03225 [Caldilineaceae bacterium]|nr:hypothetical protein [Caldilineaceae bacterium]
MNGWCDIDEIELSPVTLACITFEEMDTEVTPVGSGDGDELEWDDDESLFEEDLDESLYGYDDGDDEDEDDELLADEEDEWVS